MQFSIMSFLLHWSSFKGAGRDLGERSWREELRARQGSSMEGGRQGKALPLGLAVVTAARGQLCLLSPGLSQDKPSGEAAGCSSSTPRTALFDHRITAPSAGKGEGILGIIP